MNVLAYPAKHIVRLRYRKKHVSPTIIGYEIGADGVVKLSRRTSTQCIIVFLEGRKDDDGNVDPEKSFEFYPMRSAEVVRLQWIGQALYIDCALQDYVSYRKDGKTDAAVREAIAKRIRTLPYCPLPAPHDGRGYMWLEGEKLPYEQGKGGTGGYYFTDVPRNSDGYVEWPLGVTGSPSEQEAWESVADILATSKEFSSTLFYRVAGVFSKRTWRGEKPVRVRRAVAELEYLLPMGELAIMKVMCYVPAEGGARGVVTVASEGEGFAGISPRVVRISSRYNEERVILATKRVLDNVQSPIQLAPEVNEAAPRLLLLTRVAVPQWIPWVPVACLALAAIFLSLGPDLLETIGGQGSFWAKSKGSLSLLSKGIGGLFTAIAAYPAFKKIPLGK
ncbi:MAG: hypothetical protein ACOC95_00870 [Planctomycetota bacterium]